MQTLPSKTDMNPVRTELSISKNGDRAASQSVEALAS